MIRMVIAFLLKTVLQKPDLLDQIVKWALELGKFDVNFQPRTSIKSPVLADFVAELTQH